MTIGGHEERVAATGALLRELLATKPRYVRAWRVHGGRQRGAINQRAVARVLALYLWDAGIRPESEVTLPEQLKNVVNRALLGKRLTAATLENFIGAFDFDEGDQRLLWDLLVGSDGISHTIKRPRPMARPQIHRTVFLVERYYIDDQRMLARRRTVQCLEAREDGVSAYLFGHEPLAAEIEVIHGGSVGRHYEYGHGLVGEDIVLEERLHKGERATLEYQVRYERNEPRTEVRRAARGRVENVTIAVHFSPSRVPRCVRFAAWDDHYLGDTVREEPALLTPTGSASVCLPYIQQAVVGFRWEW